MKKITKKRIYLDYAAATPIDPQVSAAMKKTEARAWSNASSLHSEGEKTKEIIENARKEIANILHSKAGEVYFTSGGTEGANIAILGIVQKAKEKISTPHVITSSIEHPAVLQTIKSLEKWGVEVSLVDPNEKGIVSAEAIKKEIKESTVLICLMHSNNEIGTIQPVHKVSSYVKEFRKSVEGAHLRGYPFLVVDASQSVLYEDISIERLGADVLILDGIKMYGPRGAGILVVKTGVQIAPINYGGGQERGLRSGTENAIAAVGFFEALKLAVKLREKESKRLTSLRDYAINKILKEIPTSSLNGDGAERLPNNINICFGFKDLPLNNLDPKGRPWGKIDSEFLVIKLDTLGFAVSSASACSSLSLENSSYVIDSLGKKDCGSSSLRFTLGRETKKSDIDALISALKKILL